MPIIRNPFRNKDENVRPNSGVVERTNAPPKSIDLTDKQNTEYKLSGRLYRRATAYRAHVR